MRVRHLEKHTDKEQGTTWIGDCSEFLDLFLREEKRSRSTFVDQPHDYTYLAQISVDKRVTMMMLYKEGHFIGAGVAVRCESDSFIEGVGLRLAMSRALASIGPLLED